MRKARTRISIARISTNPSVRFINTQISTNRSKNEVKALEIYTLKCSEVSDNKTTYVQKKQWNIELKNYLYPPYADCGYVD